MILAVAVLAQRLAAGALEVEAGGVHEHQVEPREQVAPIREQPLLHHVLQTARREWRAAVLLFLGQLLAQPGHRPVEMMQIEPLDADDGVILAPAIGGAVGAADEQPVQHREEHGALKRKTVLAFARQLGDHRPAAGLLPQPLEHQRRPDATDRNLDRGIIAGRAQHHGFGREARTRTHQPLQLAARLQILETPERGDHLLAHLVAVPVALDDLQIGAAGRGLAAEVHGRRLRMLVRTQNCDSIGKIKSYSHRKWHYTFAKMTPRSKQNQWLISREPARSVEDGLGWRRLQSDGAIPWLAGITGSMFFIHNLWICFIPALLATTSAGPPLGSQLLGVALHSSRWRHVAGGRGDHAGGFGCRLVCVDASAVALPAARRPVVAQDEHGGEGLRGA